MEQNNDNLKQKTKKGLYWSAANNIASKGMQFIFSIILARLLSPPDYGVIGMLSIFIVIVQIFVESGFSKAIITKQDRTQKDLSTAFFFNIGVGVIGYFILFFSALALSLISSINAILQIPFSQNTILYNYNLNDYFIQ